MNPRGRCTPLLCLAALSLAVAAPAAETDAVRFLQLANATWDPPIRIRYCTDAIRLSPKLSDAWLLRAETYLSISAYDRAAADATKVIELKPEAWQAWAVRGHARLALQRYDQAMADASEAISLHPGHATLHEIRAEAYRTLGRHKEAIEDATTALRIKPRSLQALITRARSRRALGRSEPALEDLNAALGLDDQRLDVRQERARLLASLGRVKESLADCERIAAGRPDSPKPLLLMARLLADQDQFPAAVAALRRALERSPSDHRVRLELAMMQARGHQWADALETFERAIRHKPQEAMGYAYRAEAYRVQREFALALSDVGRALELDPECAYAYATQGAIHAAREEWDAALDALTTALELDPNYAFALKIRARAFGAKRLYSRAVQDAEALVRLAAGAKDRSGAYLTLGAAYRDKGLFDQSVAVLSDAIRLTPKWPLAHFRRANTYRMNGQEDKAITDCDMGLELDPNSAFGWLLRGVSNYQKEDHTRARDDIERCIKVDSEGDWSAWAEAYLAEMQRQHEAFPKAIAHANRSIALRPKAAHPMAFVVRAAAHRATGRYDEAIRDASAALRIHPAFSLAYAERAAAHRARTEYAEAVSDCDRAIALMPALQLAYYERGYALLGKFRGEGARASGRPAMLPAIIAGLGEVHVPFEIAQAFPAREPKDSTATARAAPRRVRAYTPEPVVPRPREPQAHPLDRAASDFRMLVHMRYKRTSSAAGLVRCLHDMDRFQQALAVCDAEIAAAEQTSDKAELLVLRAMVYYALGEPGRAMADARNAMPDAPDKDAASLALAYGQAILGQWPACGATCETILAREAGPAQPKALLLWFVAALREQPLRAATLELRARLKSMPAESELWPWPLVAALSQGDDLAPLAAWISQGTEPQVRRSRLCQACYYLGMAHLAAGRIAQATETLRTGVAQAGGRVVEFTLASAELYRQGVR